MYSVVKCKLCDFRENIAQIIQGNKVADNPVYISDLGK